MAETQRHNQRECWCGINHELDGLIKKTLATFEPRDPRWKLCVAGCRPAAGIHRFDCPTAPGARVVLKPKPDGGRTFS